MVRTHMAWVKLLGMLSARKGIFVATKAIKRRMKYDNIHSLSVALAQLNTRKGIVIESFREGRCVTGYRVRNIDRARKVLKEATAR